MDLELQPVSSKVYDVQIGGFSLKLKTSHKPDKVDQMIQFVEGKIEESLKNHSNISIQKALILSCLNMAEEHLQLKERASNRLNQLESTARSLAVLLKSSDVQNLKK